LRLKTSFIPSLFTILNLFSGFFAITKVIEGAYISAIILIILASIFDALDGKVARLIGKDSRFGIEFDSLADIVSFCLAPSILIYNVYLSELEIVGAMIAFFPLLFGAIRLARFNVIAQSTGRKSYYLGLPVPVSAITMTSYLWFNYSIYKNYGDPRILLPMVVTLSFLMVSKIRFSLLPHISFKRSIHYSIRSAIILLIFISMVIKPGFVIFPFFTLFIVYHIINWMNGYEEPRIVIARRRGERNG